MTTFDVHLPLDDDGALRRCCPLCNREFKIVLAEDELRNLAQKVIDSYMIEPVDESDSEESESLQEDRTCPYCGEKSATDGWWTQEQVAFFMVIAENIAAKVINENLIRPLKRMNRRPQSGLISIQFEAKEMEQKEPWISPEPNDMVIFDLPCCERKIKMEENWHNVIYCFFCGYPHNSTMPN